MVLDDTLRLVKVSGKTSWSGLKEAETLLQPQLSSLAEVGLSLHRDHL